jgi:hypothetical protein
MVRIVLYKRPHEPFETRVARWYKNPNLGSFWRALEWKMWYILWSFSICVVIWFLCGHLVFVWLFGICVVIWYLCGHLEFLCPFGIPIIWPFGIFYDHLVYFMTIWYILWPHICNEILVCCTRENLATPFETSAPPARHRGLVKASSCGSGQTIIKLNSDWISCAIEI